MIALVVLSAFWVFHDHFPTSLKTGLFISDFIGYWAPFQLFKNGKNPYDFEQVLQLELASGYQIIHDKTYSLWNLPWTLVIFAPFLNWPLEISAFLWLLMNLAFPFLITQLTLSAFFPNLKLSPRFKILTGLCLLPYLYVVQVGQTAFWVILGLIATFWAIEKKKDVLAGMLLVLTTIKPNIVYLIYGIALIWLIRTKRVRILFSFLGTLLTLILIAYLISPQVFVQRMAMKASPFLLAAPTLETWVRLLIYSKTNQMVVWPSLLIPLITWAAFLALYFKKKICWKEDLPLLIPCCLITMPYGGINDFNLLTITQAMLFFSLLEKSDGRKQLKKWAMIFLVFHLSSVLIYVFLTRELHQNVWYSFFYLILAVQMSRSTAKLAGANEY